MINVQYEVCDMVELETAFGTVKLEWIIERVSISGPLSAVQILQALPHPLEDGVSSIKATTSTRWSTAPDWTQVWKLRGS